MTVSLLLRTAVSAGFATAIISSASAAQFVFEVRQGTTWGNKLVVPENTPISFRWKWDGRTDLTSASWQMTYFVPATRDEPAIVQSAAVPISTSRISEYSAFQISPDAVPSNAPSTFYVRVRSGQLHSSWIPVTVTSPPPSGPLPVATVPNPDPPLWVKLTKIICLSVSNDGSASDEVYAVVGSVALNKQRPWASTIWAEITPLYKDMDPDDLRVTNTTLWGPPSGAATVLRKPEDAVILFSLQEHDVGNLPLIKAGGLGALGAEVKKLNTDMSYKEMERKLELAFLWGAGEAAKSYGGSDDGISGAPYNIVDFSQAEIDDARSGKVVKKEWVVGDAQHGVYKVRFQMGPAGTPSEAW